MSVSVSVSERVTLPLDVCPSHYSLELSPDLQRLEFFCNETVSVTVTREGVSEVSMHSKEISVESVHFESDASESDSRVRVNVIAINYDVKHNVVTFVFESALPKGTGQLRMRYRGILNGDMCGFYKSTYADCNGNKKIMASTQFEALDARR